MISRSLLIVAAFGVFSTASAHGSGFGEGEPCATDNYTDMVNGGCNSSPPAFNVQLDTGDFTGGVVTVKGTGSTYNIDTTNPCTTNADCPAGQTCSGSGICQTANRDTDWYLITPAALAAADVDANNVVQLRSNILSSDFDVVTFIIEINDIAGGCDASVLPSTSGCFDTQNNSNNTEAVGAVLVSDHPEGIVIFVAPGQCGGVGIFDGFECSTGNNNYEVAFTVEDTLTVTACADAASNPNLGPCNEANPGVGGCEDPNCCQIVCTDFNLICCQDEPLGWIQQCADAAMDLGCAPEPGGPVCIATGPDDTADGYLAICSDPYGSWTADGLGGEGAPDLGDEGDDPPFVPCSGCQDGFGPCCGPFMSCCFPPPFSDPDWGDEYNPPGPLTLQEASFTHGFFFFKADTQQRELLSNIIHWQQFFNPDNTLDRAIVGEESLEFDDNMDGVSDRLESAFVVTGAGVDLSFNLTQEIGLVTPFGGTVVSVLTQTLQITNNSGAPISFDLVRHADLDLNWDTGGLITGCANIGCPVAPNDVVGTDTNGSAVDRFVFQVEDGLPESGITISSPQGNLYYGSKSGIDPDGPGPGPGMGAGTDSQQWDSFGVPIGWENYIAGIGADTDGESGPNPLGIGNDGSIGLQIPVTLAGAGPSSTTTVVVHTTYGATTPLGAPLVPPCLSDCGDFDGVVGIVDFLALLSQWGGPGDCDFDGDGVGINDFLELLANWGPCP